MRIGGILDELSKMSMYKVKNRCLYAKLQFAHLDLGIKYAFPKLQLYMVNCSIQLSALKEVCFMNEG